jgi:predicted nucleotide-binding protein (sugar kinase/HSP70/actin superfamily)
MKVGDLVVLSNRGSSLKKNWRIVGGIGIVTEVIQYYSYYDYKIRWTTTKGGLRTKDSFLKRYELKYLKPDKKCP